MTAFTQAGVNGADRQRELGTGPSEWDANERRKKTKVINEDQGITSNQDSGVTVLEISQTSVTAGVELVGSNPGDQNEMF